MADEVRIKKVNAYPIASTFKFGTVALQGQVMKLTQHGFLAEVATGSLKPGEKFECSFELPVLHKVIAEPCVVVKLYTQWAGKQAAVSSAATTPTAAVQAPGAPVAKTMTLVEAHFQAASVGTKENVANFLSAMAKSK